MMKTNSKKIDFEENETNLNFNGLVDYDQDERIWKPVAYTSSRYSNVDKINHHTYSGVGYRFIIRRDQIYNRKVVDYNLFRSNHEVAFTYLVKNKGINEI
ncbi:hypothetical protein [Mycoplasma testudineum]|nr:hypothetical protein [Mycoplasma testudineum]